MPSDPNSFDPNSAKLAVPAFDPGSAKITPTGDGSIMPSWLQDVVKYGPGFLAENGRKALASGMGSLNNMAGTFSTLPTVPGMLMKAARAGAGNAQPVIDAVDVPLAQGASLPETLLDKAARGTGAALALPIPGAGLLGNVLPGAVGGMTGEMAGRYAEGVSPSLKPYGELAGNILGGTGTGFLLGPRQSVAEQDIRTALKGTTPEGFDRARQLSQTMQDAGAKTATAAEAFPAGSGIMALANQTRGTNLDNSLRTVTQNRPNDLQDLGTEFLNRISPRQVDPNAVANRTSDSANAVLDNIRQLRGTGLGNRLMGQQVPAHAVEGMRLDLLNLADIAKRPAEGNAYRQVAASLLDQKGQPITDVQQLSLSIKSLKDAAKNPNALFNGNAISGVDLSQAIKNTEQELGSLSPAFQGGMQDFRDFSRNVLAPTQAGPIGRLADRNPLTAGPTPVGRLGTLLSGNTPDTVRNTAQTLGDVNLTNGQITNPLDIAKALAMQKLATGSVNPGQAIRGNAGSPAEANFNALLEAGGVNPATVNQPLVAADSLQSFAGPAGHKELPRMSLTNLIRPFRTIDMFTSGRTEHGVNRDVANLLSKGGPDAVTKLQKIAMFDPGVRRMLTLRGLMAPVINQENK